MLHGLLPGLLITENFEDDLKLNNVAVERLGRRTAKTATVSGT